MDKHYEYLLLAFEEAEKAKSEGTFPIGAVIVDVDGTQLVNLAQCVLGQSCYL